MQTVFCVEDDSNIRELIVYTLISSGFDALGFENGAAFFKHLKSSKPDMILLDIMLPDMDGMEILKAIRKDSSVCEIPVIMLTAKSERIDKIKGLDAGADDYITKPFDVLELVSRVRAVLRRTTGQKEESEIVYKNIRLDRSRRMVYASGREVSLTYKEYELLYMLLSANGKVVGREQIVSYVWGTEFEGESRTLDVHIRTLRQKLGEDGNCIETVRNVGYKVG